MDPFGLFVVLAPYILITGIVGAQWFSRRQFRRFIPRFLGIFLGYMVGVAGALVALFAGFMASSLLAPQYETVDPNVFLVATIAGVFVATVFMTWLLGQLLLLLIALPNGLLFPPHGEIPAGVTISQTPNASPTVPGSTSIPQ